MVFRTGTGLNKETSEKEIRKTIPFTKASKTIKYLGINLTKEVKDLYTEEYKTLMKEIEDTNGKISRDHNSEEVILLKFKILLKCLVYPKLFINSIQALSKFHVIFTEIEKQF